MSFSFNPYPTSSGSSGIIIAFIVILVISVIAYFVLFKKKITWTEHKLSNTTESADKQASACVNAGGVYTNGNNTDYPGCETGKCCKPSDPAWLGGKKPTDYKWNSQAFTLSPNAKWPEESFNQANLCVKSRGLFVGGNVSKFPGDRNDDSWCISINAPKSDLVKW